MKPWIGVDILVFPYNGVFNRKNNAPNNINLKSTFFPCVRETRYKRLEDVWFYLNDILERQAFRDRKRIALREGRLSGREEEEKLESLPEISVLTSLSDGLHPVRRDTPQP